MTGDSFANFDPMKIVEAFNRRGTEYVVIGGFAAELHAAPVPPTRDIDFTPTTWSETPSVSPSRANRCPWLPWLT